MADTKISELPSGSPTDGSELVPVVQGGITKKSLAKEIARIGYQDILTEPATSRTLALSDLGKWIRFTGSTSVTLTVPANGTVAIPVGTTLNFIQAGAGKITIAAASGVTVNRAISTNAVTRGQFSSFALVKVGSNEWDLIGDLEASA